MLKVSSISLGYFWIFEGFWNFSANCVSSRHCSEVPHICRIFPNFFIIFVCNPSSVLISSCISVSSMGREQERRTKQKMDHPSQSSSPHGDHRNYKRPAQRSKLRSISGTSQGRPAPSAPHRISPNGSDGYWN